MKDGDIITQTKPVQRLSICNLEKLLVENFQCHEDTEIEFSPGVTCIVGATDRGKSSLIRALIWTMTNYPRGDSFIKQGCDETKVTLWVDGHKIVRKRGDGVNYYLLDDGSPYEDFRKNPVPEDIEKILNIDPISLQRQLDPPFLFSSSPGEVSKQLNTIVNLDLIDSVLSSLLSDQRKIKASIQVGEERYEKAKQRREELKWTKDADNNLKIIEDLEKEVGQEKESISDLNRILEDVSTVDSQLQEGDSLIKGMTSLVGMGEGIIYLQERVDDLSLLLSEIEATNSTIEKTEKEIEEIRSEFQLNECPLCGSTEGVISL